MGGFENYSGELLNNVSRVVEGTSGQFNHFFGGRPWHRGILPRGCTVPLHLLYTFDTTDPLFPIKFPHVRYLPLYYSFVYNGGACGYRVKSDSEIEVLHMENEKPEKDFPYKDYPSEFPERAVRLDSISHDQHKTLVYFLNAGKERLNEEERKLIYEQFDYPFTQLGGVHRMWQGIPSVACPNPDCSNSKHTCFMDVFAVIWNRPHKDIFLWEKLRVKKYAWEKIDDGHNDVIEIIFQYCPKCFAIHACNRCS